MPRIYNFELMWLRAIRTLITSCIDKFLFARPRSIAIMPHSCFGIEICPGCEKAHSQDDASALRNLMNEMDLGDGSAARWPCSQRALERVGVISG